MAVPQYERTCDGRRIATSLRLFNNSRFLIGRTMKFAAIADVHGNCVALEAVLADIAAIGITEVVNLGDHVA